MGESEYYYVIPGQEDWTSLEDVKTVDIPSADTQNPYLQQPTFPVHLLELIRAQV